MKIPFTKMQGLGNDFVLIDGLTYPNITVTPQIVKQLADRHFGIGFDQLLWILASKDPSADFILRIFNADGSEVGQCGNGVRCVARYVYDKKLTPKECIRFATKTTKMQATIENDHQISVDMGTPKFAGLQSFTVDGHQFQAYLVDLGNPHAVLRVDSVAQAPVDTLGKAMQSHPHFAGGVNVSFMQVLDPQHVKLRVFERGSGETLACGSAACATMAAGYQQGFLEKAVRVSLPGGELLIQWDGDPSRPIKMTGPAEVVFTGECDLHYPE